MRFKMISPEERQKRIDQIENENQALKELNDFNSLRERVKSEPSIMDQLELNEENTSKDPLKKTAIPPVEPLI